MHALIETDTLTDRGNRKDFGQDTPPDLSHKNPPLKWVPVVVSADPAYNPDTHRLQQAADVVTLTELTRSKEAVALDARTIQRNTMKANYESLPANTRANYEWLFQSVQNFLDKGDDDLAVIAVQEADPIAAISGDSGRLTAFENARSQFIASIQALPPAP